MRSVSSAVRLSAVKEKRNPGKRKLVQAGPGWNALGVRGGRCDRTFSRLKREQVLEQRQISFNVTGRGLAGRGGPQFLAKSRLQKSRGQFGRVGNAQDV